MLFDRRDDRRRRGLLQIEMQHERPVQVLLKIQAPLPLPLRPTVLTPETRSIQRIRIVPKVQAGQIRVRRHSGHLRPLFHVAVDRAVRMRGAVIIAEGDQWPYLKQALAPVEVTGYLVANHRGVLAMHQEHTLLDLYSVYKIREQREGMRLK